MQEYHVRWMIRRDMPEVLQVEQGSFPHPWSEEDFLKCLRTRNIIGMVAEEGEIVLGFMVYELHKTKLHILNFAVHPDHRGKGVARSMIRKLMSKLSSHRRVQLTLDIRESNLAGQLFLRKHDFKAVKPILRGYYEDTGEDAYTMQYTYTDLYQMPAQEEVPSVNRVFGQEAA